MKHIKKYPGLFENSEHQSSREDQLQVLDDLLQTGLISQSEYAKLQFDLDPDQYATFHIELEFDWSWAAQHTSEEALNLLNIESRTKSVFPENSIIGPVKIDDWVEGDHWEPGDDGVEAKYDLQVFARFDLYYNRKNNLEELRELLKGFLGRVFSSISCNGVDISDEPIEWPNQLGEAVSIQDLSPRDERPMVEGIASILRKVRDVENRKEIADAQIREFGRDGIRFDYAQFLKLCGL